MGKPLDSFVVKLGRGFWLRINIYATISESAYSDGTEAALFQEEDYPMKIGEIHIAVEHLDVATASHEAYHAVSCLRKRGRFDEEWLAQRVERITHAIMERKEAR